jgi:hypothetical protein
MHRGLDHAMVSQSPRRQRTGEALTGSFGTPTLKRSSCIGLPVFCWITVEPLRMFLALVTSPI